MLIPPGLLWYGQNQTWRVLFCCCIGFSGYSRLITSSSSVAETISESRENPLTFSKYYIWLLHFSHFGSVRKLSILQSGHCHIDSDSGGLIGIGSSSWTIGTLVGS